jgi:hypothetical protein
MDDPAVTAKQLVDLARKHIEDQQSRKEAARRPRDKRWGLRISKSAASAKRGEPTSASNSKAKKLIRITTFAFHASGQR